MHAALPTAPPICMLSCSEVERSAAREGRKAKMLDSTARVLRATPIKQRRAAIKVKTSAPLEVFLEKLKAKKPKMSKEKPEKRREAVLLPVLSEICP